MKHLLCQSVFIVQLVLQHWSFGLISLCTNDTTSTQNGSSVPAKIGAPVTVSSCYQVPHSYTDFRIYHVLEYHQLSTGLYRVYRDGDSRIHVQEVPFTYDRAKKKVYITITSVEDQDFHGEFCINALLSLIYTRDTCRWFRLNHEDGVTFNVTNMTTPTSITNDISYTTRVAHPWCHPQNNSGCPEMWYPVDSDLCLTVFPSCKGSTTEDNCYGYGNDLAPGQFSNDMRSCLTYLLQNSTTNVVMLGDNTFFDVLNGSNAQYQWPHCVACVLEKHKFVQPVIESFYIETWLIFKWRQDLLNIHVSYVQISATEPMVMSCSVSGHSKPKLTIMFANVTQVTITNEQSDGYTFSYLQLGDCPKSGVYSCLVKNLVGSTIAQKEVHFSRPMVIKSFIIQPSKHRGLNNDTEMRCLVNVCPEPTLLTIINDINQTLNIVAGSYSLVHEITRVQCSDMGTYYCRAESQDGHILQENADLIIDRCPVQLCRGEEMSKVIPVALNQTLNFSICLVSVEEPFWESKNQTTTLSVDITKTINTQIYWLANITIFDIKVIDHGTTIRITNKHGRLDYHVDRPEKLQENPSEKLSSAQFNVGLLVGVVLGIVAITMTALIITVATRKGTRRGGRTSQGEYIMPYTPYVVITDSTQAKPQNETGGIQQVHYEEIREVQDIIYEDIIDDRLNKSAVAGTSAEKELTNIHN